MQPTVTIGTCVRNCAKTIPETIKSIINQDFPHELMEMIFVDDGSQDNTLQVIESWSLKTDIKTRVFHDRWWGLGHVRNTVANHSLGEYIIWVDGDMTIPRDYVRKQVTFMEQHVEVGIAKGKFSMSPGPNAVATLEIYSRGVGGIRRRKKNTVRSLGTGGCIYRVKAIQEVGGFDQNLRGYGEDWDIEIRIREAGWSLEVTDAQFRDHERFGLTYGKLWTNGAKRGHDLHRFNIKNKGLISLYRMSPPAAFLSSVLDISVLYRKVRDPLVLLLPLHSAFKAAAWFWGYLKASPNLS